MSETGSENKTLTTVKTTAIGTAVVVVIAMQITLLRALGDVISSLAIFALGYLACVIRNKKK